MAFAIFNVMPNIAETFHVMKPIFPLLIVCAFSLLPVGLAWDGDWTSGASGEYLYDSESTQGKSGVTTAPQNFLIPPVPDYDDVDPEELDDYFRHGKREYSPYALARVSRELRYNDKIVIPQGYYLVKVGDFRDGSPKTNISQAGVTLSLEKPSRRKPSTKKTLPEDVPAIKSKKHAPPVLPRVFILKKLGKVVAVVPIHRAEHYIPALDRHKDKAEKGEPEKPPSPPEGWETKTKKKLPSHALAWIEIEDRRPVLRFYHRHLLYSTTFQ
jgi:hypothetical protein